MEMLPVKNTKDQISKLLNMCHIQDLAKCHQVSPTTTGPPDDLDDPSPSTRFCLETVGDL